MKKERLVAFTDAVLAIIMTILVLELARPEKASLAAFWALRYNYFAYTLSFFWLGSLWMGLNGVWEHAEYINNKVIFWNLALLFFASFIPYATDLVSENFNNRIMQGFYGIIVIVMTLCNLRLHKVLDLPNIENPALLEATRSYRKLLFPDIMIKFAGLILAVTVYPPLMMYAVLAAAFFIIVRRKHMAHKPF